MAAYTGFLLPTRLSESRRCLDYAQAASTIFFLDSCCIQILCLCTQLPSHPLTAFVGPLLGVDVAQWLIGRALGRLDLHLAV